MKTTKTHSRALTIGRTSIRNSQDKFWSFKHLHPHHAMTNEDDNDVGETEPSDRSITIDDGNGGGTDETENGFSEEIILDPSDELLEEIKEAAPSKFVIMKELLGINIFTYILAGAAIFFLSLNSILGPGWLGQIIGLEGTGTFTNVSPSLPDTVDLSQSQYLL